MFLRVDSDEGVENIYFQFLFGIRPIGIPKSPVARGAKRFTHVAGYWRGWSKAPAEPASLVAPSYSIPLRLNFAMYETSFMHNDRLVDKVSIAVCFSFVYPSLSNCCPGRIGDGRSIG